MCRKSVCLLFLVVLLGLTHSVCAEVPRDPNLVIYYSFDSVGAIVPDESGKGHHGTVCGDVSGCPSGIKWYGAAEFLGEWGPTKYSYLDLDSPHYPAEDIPRSAITLAAWVQCRKTGKDHAILSCRASDNTWVIHPQINDNGTFRWLLRSPGSVTIFNLNGVGTHGWDEWIHYAGTYDSKTGHGVLYINGAVCAPINVTPGQIIADWGTGARVGYNIDNARPFTGIMDEFYLFTRALTELEVNELLAAEVLPSEKASHPNPANGAELQTTSAVLLWLPGVYATSNNIYFGEDFQDVNDGANGTF
ncbi:MAG: LamG domain-containing protein, partial [Phycisphaerae bacterium]|nr:LamG domain-containing protein [Phycisphaerae bacterium]